MPQLRFIALPTETVRELQAGSADANGQSPEERVSDGAGTPCRHCLEDVAEGAPFLVLAHRPFPALQPYAELGPIFLHRSPCQRYAPAPDVPPVLRGRDQILIRGYGADDRIVYGTDRIVSSTDLVETAASLLASPDVAYAHVRSASNNCYLCRIERAAD